MLLSVHTVGPSFDNEPYAHAPGFYRATGFSPLEELNNLDWPGPPLILVRKLQIDFPVAVPFAVPLSVCNSQSWRLMHDRHRPAGDNWCSASRPFPPAVRHIPGLDDEVRFGFVNVRQDYLTDI